MVNLKNIIFLALCSLFASCSPREIREAKHTVTLADSLWHAGTPCDDSTSLAQAYETLGALPFPFREVLGVGSAYAHACYHYGRLLRQKENPVEAMQVFINATHSHTRDYHILGRIYSNMGDIAHLANEFELSYDMYKRSGDMYLKNKDTLLYYYDLNNMVYELAELGKKEESIKILNLLKNYNNDDLQVMVELTTAKLYIESQLYDSALYILNKAPNFYATSYVLKERAFEHLGMLDSALYYAQKVLSLPSASEQDKYNMLYVIINYDTTLVNEEIITLSSQRSDIETDVLIPLHNLWAMSIHLLDKDLHRKPDWRWLYVVCGLVLFLCACSILYNIWRKRKQHSRIIQEVQEKEVELNTLSKIQETQHQQIIKDIEEVSRLIIESQDMKAELTWMNFNQMCAIINRRFYGLADRLQVYSLSQKELRLCVLVLLQASTKQMIDMIPYSQSGLGKFKNTTAQKIGTTTKQMRSYIINLIS